MVGSGFSLVFTPSIFILGHYFKRYHGVVNGFVTIGSALFGVVLPHVFKLLFQEVGVSTKKLKNLFCNLIVNMNNSITHFNCFGSSSYYYFRYQIHLELPLVLTLF